MQQYDRIDYEPITSKVYKQWRQGNYILTLN